jgi:hypothetical protein
MACNLIKEIKMYKKVTHTITEEHFGHPMAIEIKKAVDKKIIPHPKPKLEPVSAEKFRSDVTAYFAGLNNRLSAIIAAIAADDSAALATAETAYFTEADVIGELYKPYYGIEFSERINNNMRTLGLLAITLARNIKFKVDTKDWMNRLTQTADFIANLMYQFNNAWPTNINRDTWIQINDALLAQSQAAQNRDTTAINTAKEKSNTLMSVFANTFANGLIQQHPEKFIA